MERRRRREPEETEEEFDSTSLVEASSMMRESECRALEICLEFALKPPWICFETALFSKHYSDCILYSATSRLACNLQVVNLTKLKQCLAIYRRSANRQESIVNFLPKILAAKSINKRHKERTKCTSVLCRRCIQNGLLLKRLIKFHIFNKINYKRRLAKEWGSLRTSRGRERNP